MTERMTARALMLAGGLALLTACGTTPAERTTSGAGIGVGVAALAGANLGWGALLGAGTGYFSR